MRHLLLGATALAAIWLPSHTLAQQPGPIWNGTQFDTNTIIMNSANTGSAPGITVGGQTSDANIDLNISAKGTGHVNINNLNGTPGFTVDPAGNTTIAGTLQVDGTTAITGFGVAIGQALGPLINYQSSGIPGLLLGSQGIVFSRSSNAATNGVDFHIQRTTSFTTADRQVRNAFRIDTTIGASDGSDSWGFLSTMTAGGTNGGTAVAGYLQATRPPGAGGQEIWSLVTESRDHSLVSSGTAGGGATLSQEIDITADKADDAASPNTFGGFGVRKAVQMVFNQFTNADPTPAGFSNGIWAGTDLGGGSSYVSSFIGFAVGSQIGIGLDMRGSIPPPTASWPVSAVTMAAGMTIDFNGSASTLSAAPGNYLAYDSGTSRLKYYIAGVAKFSVDASGNLRAAGTLTGSTTP